MHGRRWREDSNYGGRLRFLSGEGRGVGGGVSRARHAHGRRGRLGWGVGWFGPARLSWAGSPRRRRKIEKKRDWAKKEERMEFRPDDKKKEA